MDKKKIIGVIAVLLFVGGFVGYKMMFPTYDVIFDSKAGTSIAAQKVKKGETAKEVADPVMPGYKFLGWYLDDKEYDFSTPVTKNITLTGHWEKEEQ
jgi:uncharacterized repeat protein (TIGR02543 family)